MFEQLIRQVAKAARDATIREIEEQRRNAGSDWEKLAWMAALVFLGAASAIASKPSK